MAVLLDELLPFATTALLPAGLETAPTADRVPLVIVFLIDDAPLLRVTVVLPVDVVLPVTALLPVDVVRFAEILLLLLPVVLLMLEPLLSDVLLVNTLSDPV